MPESFTAQLYRFIVTVVRHDLSRSPVLRDLPRDADALPLVLALRRPKLAAVLAPDQHREDLIRVRLVEIEEVGCPLVDAA